MIQMKIKRPRKPRVFRPFLSASGPCQHHKYCDSCMSEFADEAETNRPGHVWAVEDGKIIYLEDVVVEHRMGRKLKATESVIHKNGNLHDNRSENLEVVTLPEMEK